MENLEPARSFQDLLVWKKAHQFVLDIYKLTDQFPKHELFGLTSQLRRAAVSIPANIAEGFKKRNADKNRFLNIALSSADECHYYLILAQDLGYGNFEKQLELLTEILKMVNIYSRKVTESIRNSKR